MRAKKNWEREKQRMNAILPQAAEWVKAKQIFPVDLSIIGQFLKEANLSR
jgi:hypothetical protein